MPYVILYMFLGSTPVKQKVGLTGGHWKAVLLSSKKRLLVFTSHLASIELLASLSLLGGAEGGILRSVEVCCRVNPRSACVEVGRP